VQFFFQVVLDPLDGRTVAFEEQIGSTGVTVVRKPNASSIDEKPGMPGDVANERAMSMPIDNGRPVERAVDGCELSIAGLVRRRSPAALRSRMDQCEALLRAYQAGRAATPISPLLERSGSLTLFPGLPSKELRERKTGWQNLLTNRAGKAFHRCCPSPLASRADECDRRCRLDWIRGRLNRLREALGLAMCA
jgi:hypothetical protein